MGGSKGVLVDPVLLPHQHGATKHMASNPQKECRLVCLLRSGTWTTTDVLRALQNGGK